MNCRFVRENVLVYGKLKTWRNYGGADNGNTHQIDIIHVSSDAVVPASSSRPYALCLCISLSTSISLPLFTLVSIESLAYRSDDSHWHKRKLSFCWRRRRKKKKIKPQNVIIAFVYDQSNC